MDPDKIDEIDMALHGIQQMIEVSIRSAVYLHGSEKDKGTYSMPREEAELLCFSIYDLEMRVKAFRTMINPEYADHPRRRQPAVLSIVRDPA